MLDETHHFILTIIYTVCWECKIFRNLHSRVGEILDPGLDLMPRPYCKLPIPFFANLNFLVKLQVMGIHENCLIE